jgi:hypothetical protein
MTENLGSKESGKEPPMPNSIPEGRHLTGKPADSTGDAAGGLLEEMNKVAVQEDDTQVLNFEGVTDTDAEKFFEETKQLNENKKRWQEIFGPDITLPNDFDLDALKSFWDRLFRANNQKGMQFVARSMRAASARNALKLVARMPDDGRKT